MLVTVLRENEVIAFVHTSDVERARAFYVDVLELELVEENPFALAVRAGGTTIRVTPVDAHAPSPHTVLGWSVADVAAEVRQLADRDVVTLRFPGMEQDAQGIWRSPSGARVAWFADPDGNTLSLTQY
jgi:catechol 2,3-dioxygenase-like lactoylglutathione lyase family enzyme